jgi:hypothetical protein
MLELLQENSALQDELAQDSGTYSEGALRRHLHRGQVKRDADLAKTFPGMARLKPAHRL